MIRHDAIGIHDNVRSHSGGFADFFVYYFAYSREMHFRIHYIAENQLAVVRTDGDVIGSRLGIIVIPQAIGGPMVIGGIHNHKNTTTERRPAGIPKMVMMWQQSVGTCCARPIPPPAFPKHLWYSEKGRVRHVPTELEIRCAFYTVG